MAGLLTVTVFSAGGRQASDNDFALTRSVCEPIGVSGGTVYGVALPVVDAAIVRQVSSPPALFWHNSAVNGAASAGSFHDGYRVLQIVQRLSAPSAGAVMAESSAVHAVTWKFYGRVSG